MFFFWTLFLSILHLSASQGRTIIPTGPGHDVSLPCRAGGDGEIIAVKWCRPDLGSDYVFLFRNNKPETGAQHPSYQNRVNLQDRQMKDGDVSLVLKNLTTDDTGIYECRVYQRKTNKNVESVSTVILEVGQPVTAEPGQNATLPGPVPSNYKRPYRAVEWSRGKGQEPEQVFLLINGTSDPVFKPPSYQKRVNLQDRQMENGNVSLVLKNVTTDDGGTYECRVTQTGGTRRKRAVDPPIISTVYLEVSPPPPPSGAEDGGNQQQGDQDGGGKDRGGRPGLAVGLPAAAIMVFIVMAAAAAAAGVRIHRKKKNPAPPQSDSKEKVPISSLADQTDQQPDV